jgi:hypothetical protein
VERRDLGLDIVVAQPEGLVDGAGVREVDVDEVSGGPEEPDAPDADDIVDAEIVASPPRPVERSAERHRPDADRPMASPHSTSGEGSGPSSEWGPWARPGDAAWPSTIPTWGAPPTAFGSAPPAVVLGFTDGSTVAAAPQLAGLLRRAAADLGV